MATIKDIAREANVSVSTVSYALNDGPRSVPSEVKERILGVASRLHYRPNRLARSLITRKSNVIGIISPRVELDMVIGPYFMSMLNGVVNTYEAIEQDVLILTQIKSTDSREAIYPLLDGRCDGAIFLAPSETSAGLEYLAEIGFPHVVLNGRNSSSPSFCVDNKAGMQKGLQHFAELGHTKIGMILGPEDLTDGHERNVAFREGMIDLGLNLNPEWIVSGNFQPHAGLEGGRRLLALKDRPTAVFCANDETAMGFYRACHEAGLKIPHDLSIIGFDDVPSASLIEPGLTTIRQPLREMAESAAKLLISLVEDYKLPQSHRFVPSLVVRQSTACPMEDN